MQGRSTSKLNYVAQTDKENLPFYDTSFMLFQKEVSVPPRVEIEYRFAETYSPEKHEFHAVPLVKEIEFANICTGPPWTTGDDVETKRRKEMEDVDLVLTDTAELLDQSTSLNPSTDPPTFSHHLFANMILSLLQPSPEILEYSYNFKHLTISSEVGVPLTYIRAKIPEIYQYFFLNEKTATHNLHLTSVNHESTVLPIHDLVLIAQCFEVQDLVTLRSNSPGNTKSKPSLFVENVPDLDSFRILLKWLYTNNEDELYEILRDSFHLLLGFAMNCKFWGIVDFRVTGVIRKLLEDFGYEIN